MQACPTSCHACPAMIPRLLSQTWKSDRLTGEAARCRDSWLRLNPQLNYRLHDDSASRAVVADVAPEFLAVYDALPFPVMRADIYRYAVIHRDGGLYADIDMECLRPLPDSLFATGCLLAEEARLTRRRMAELGYPAPVQIANCIFGARPGHPFFLAALQRAFTLAQAAPHADRSAIEDITGPRMLTRLFFEQAWPDVSVTPNVVLMAPLHYPYIWPVNRNMYARHRTFGTWKEKLGRKALSRTWIERNLQPNPFPPAILADRPGYLRALGAPEHA
ncbi:MAG: hypothetical protein CMJ42_03035 [Phyllobacteriaceae bacterium]|nr:hypothetical protein [Phyllobacteriaceae bacterium]MBA93053.1 hypothetical protein [Phyllobacteriaceae bacterium]